MGAQHVAHLRAIHGVSTVHDVCSWMNELRKHLEERLVFPFQAYDDSNLQSRVLFLRADGYDSNRGELRSPSPPNSCRIPPSRPSKQAFSRPAARWVAESGASKSS